MIPMLVATMPLGFTGFHERTIITFDFLKQKTHKKVCIFSESDYNVSIISIGMRQLQLNKMGVGEE